MGRLINAPVERSVGGVQFRHPSLCADCDNAEMTSRLNDLLSNKRDLAEAVLGKPGETNRCIEVLNRNCIQNCSVIPHWPAASYEPCIDSMLLTLSIRKGPRPKRLDDEWVPQVLGMSLEVSTNACPGDAVTQAVSNPVLN